MEIRLARVDELDAVRDIVERSYEKYVERIGRRPAPMDDDYSAHLACGQLSVAVANDEPVGLIVTIAGAGHLSVETVAVEPSHQGEGIGRALLEHAEEIAARTGLSEIRLYTNAKMTENLVMYPGLGYRQTDRRYDDGFDRVFFVKDLTVD